MSNAAVKLQEQYSVNVKLCHPFIEAIVNTLKVQCGLTATVGKPAFKDLNSEDKPNVIIQATIANPSSLASVSIVLNTKVFLGIMGAMLGEKYTEITPDLEDGAKELMNIVFNQAKKPLAEKGFAAIRSIPSVIFGDNIRIRYLSRGAPVVLPFDTDKGHFSVEITTQEISASDSV